MENKDYFYLEQMYKEGVSRFSDGIFLTAKRKSNSGYLLQLLGFELFLKSSLYIDKGKKNHSHNYCAIFCALSEKLKTRILSDAQSESQIFDIGNRIEELLKWYSYNFIRLRYPFESYKGFTKAEYTEYSNLYAELGYPDGEAEFEYYPNELRGLVFSLEGYIKEHL